MIVDKKGSIVQIEPDRPHVVILTAYHHLIGATPDESERTLPRLHFYLPVGQPVVAALSDLEFEQMASDAYVLMDPEPDEKDLRKLPKAPTEAPLALLPGNMLSAQKRVVQHEVGYNRLQAVA